MDVLNTPVAEQGNPSAGFTPAAGSGGAPLGAGATPPVQNDEVVKKQIAEAVQKYEDDIRKLKSTYDRRDAQRQQDFAKREEDFNRKLRELEVRGMDEETRKKYESEHRDDEFQRVVKEKQQYEQQLRDIQQAQSYEKFFLESGVPANKLVLDQGLEVLAESGWNALREMVGTLREENEKLKKGASVSNDGRNLPEPPQTLTHNNQNPSQMSISEAAKRYAGGDEDRLYSMIEKGTISSSILNLPKET